MRQEGWKGKQNRMTRRKERKVEEEGRFAEERRVSVRKRPH